MEKDSRLAVADVDVRFDTRMPSQTRDWSQYSYRWRPWRQRITGFTEIVEANYQGGGNPRDPFIVKWLDTDPEDPQTYSTWFKVTNLIICGLMCFCITLASSAYTAVAEQVMDEFDCSQEVFLVGLSLMLVGFALGPLVFAPLSEAFGRRNVVLATLAIHTLWAGLCCMARNIQTLLVFRLFCGIFGSPALVIPAGQLADIFGPKERGLAMAVFAAAPWLGPTVGPSIGGYLGLAAGWRWVMGFLAIFAGVLCILGAVFVPETYAPILLRKRAQLLSKVTGKTYITALDEDHPYTFKDMLKRSLIRPWALLFREPIVLLLSTYMAVVYAFLNLNFAAFPIVYQEGYGWNAGQGGLAFYGILVGILIGIGLMYFDNRRYICAYNATGGFVPPETRLPTAIVGGVIAIIGLAWFAATADPTFHFLIPISSGVPFGVGFILIFQACFNYLYVLQDPPSFSSNLDRSHASNAQILRDSVDSYVIYTASVTAANIVLRATLAAAFPLFTPKMYDNLGVHWASAVPAFIALACFPFPIFFWKYGERIRRRCRYSAEAAKYLDALKSDREKRVAVVGEKSLNGEVLAMRVMEPILEERRRSQEPNEEDGVHPE
ncbi:uncharacterized protein A1O9_10546 [Exophiala aquamarina CBS 119918]|uniref:Major facilitator superfamily (MFS) profile domain-containing protein n=1 Tax=Exophiala aquamarina CBS 119918 TaxID=1182545 RepID=A0A072P150_9EURO|nr:uncharacterized protein A1O9_10546 [Exophiala aquamarina CBS 119918]KEF53571.1 hypothetical protein A1O9_10546 [Exophiala aquamarina CBS 119918]